MNKVVSPPFFHRRVAIRRHCHCTCPRCLMDLRLSLALNLLHYCFLTGIRFSRIVFGTALAQEGLLNDVFAEN